MKRTKLNLHLAKSSLPDDVERGAVARVIPVGKTKAKQQQLVIPAGRGKKTASVDVAPGKYVIETRLPTGAMIRQSIDVGDEPETSVAVETEESAHPWLSMQAPAEVFEQRAVRPTIKGASRTKVHALAVDRMRADTWRVLGELGRSRLPTVDDIRTAFGAAVPVEAAHASRADRISTYLWDSDYGLPQTVIVIERPGVLELVPIPVPWMTQYLQPAAVECAVPDDPLALVRCTIRDPDFGAVLGHLVAGSLADARQLLEPDLLKWLNNDEQNPYAGALGACVLVKTETSQKPLAWDPWIEMLADNWPSLPDGAALLGVRRLRRAKTTKDLAGVRDAFLETVRRGVPTFAPIAAMFLQGLTTLVADESFDSGELDQHLPAVRSTMLRMQSGHAFTVLRFEGKGKR